MNESSRSRGLPELHMRIGINSGSVAEGDIGARGRYNFTLVGDAVNLAARLEEMGKTLFPGETEVVLVGHTTHALANVPDISFADCGLQQIRGREAPEHVYRIVIDQAPNKALDPDC